MFQPIFKITPKIAQSLMDIEAAKQSLADLPMTAQLQARLRETARLLSSHYSTQIEGNRLTLEEAAQVLKKNRHFPERERDEQEILGYYRALDELERIIKTPRAKITEKSIKTLHSLVMNSRKGKVRPTPYRKEQNVIRDSVSGGIVYMPPEAKDVSILMEDLVNWLEQSKNERLPCPLRSAIAHYQFATIHPYYDGNGRTARLLATLVLYLDGYDLKGFYSLEEYYAKDLNKYYDALTVGPSHNYYMGRAEADITEWIDYFCTGMAISFKAVEKQAREAAKGGKKDHSKILRALDARKRKALSLFQEADEITSAQVGYMFGLQSRTARNLCRKWVEQKFFVVTDSAKKSRKYSLSKSYRGLIR